MKATALNRSSVRGRLANDTTRNLALVVAAGVALRLLAMPFTLHFDAYQIYSRAHEAAYHNDWFGFTSQFIIQSIHNLWLLIVRPLLPDSHAIWSETASTLGVGASREDYERFLAYDHLYRAIFLMKLPYVIADLACAWTLTKLVPAGKRLAVAALWLLNPLVIFSSAIYGRHDSIAILLVLVSVVAARRATDMGRLVGLGLLGVATLTRFFPAIIVPLFLLAFRRTARQLALFLGLLVGLVALVELAGLVTSGSSTILTILDTYEHFQYWFDAGLYLRFDDWIFLFPVVYVVALLWVSERGITPDEYLPFSAAAFLLLFSVTFFHPHYAIWLVPFLALTIPLHADARRLTIYHAIQIACVLIYSAQWGSWTTWDLFEPLLGDRVDSLPDPVEAIDSQIEPRLFFGMFRSILTAVSLWMIWKILRPVVRGVGFVLLILLLTTACTARVTGHTSPIAHDYGPVEWRGLQQTVVQPFVTGPGHQAAIANDGKTTPAQFQERLTALPEDARTGTLQEIEIGLRLAGQQGIEPLGAWSTGASVQIVDANGAVLLDTSVDSLPRDGDWLRIEEPPDLAPGQVVDLRVVPGDGPDAARLEYGVTRDRAPYGSWIATNEAGESAGGALLLRTTYERDVALRSIVNDAASNLRDAASGDMLFGALWVLALASLVVTGGWFWRKPAREG